MIKDIYHENFCLISGMLSDVVNQGAETLWGEGKNHAHDRGHDYGKHDSNP